MSDLDTKNKIVEAATYLFGVKGYDGTSTREIAKRAGVNIASLNYHFRSKQGLLQAVTVNVIEEFRQKIHGLFEAGVKDTTDFSCKLYGTMTEEGPKFLNHFKLFLDAGNCCDVEPQPIGYEHLSALLRKELKVNVPDSEILWARSVIFNYIMHTAVMSVTEVGKRHIENFLPQKEESIPLYIKQLVETLIRDLNFRYK